MSRLFSHLLICLITIALLCGDVVSFSAVHFPSAPQQTPSLKHASQGFNQSDGLPIEVTLDNHPPQPFTIPVEPDQTRRPDSVGAIVIVDETLCPKSADCHGRPAVVTHLALPLRHPQFHLRI